MPIPLAITDVPFVTSAEVSRYRREHRRSVTGRSSTAGGFWYFWIAAGLALFGVGTVSVLSTRVTLSQIGGVDALLVAAIALWGLALATALATLLLISIRRRRAWKRRAVCDRLARTAGMTFTPETALDLPDGSLLTELSSEGIVIDQFREPETDIEFGNFRPVSRTVRGQRTYSRPWGYISVQLGRRLPHLILDARANGSLYHSGLRMVLAKNQVLSLEGDFDRHFTLYCPEEHGRAALYIFTPNLMQAMIELGGAFDLELIDDRAVLHSRDAFDFLKPATWSTIDLVVSELVPVLRRQTQSYADERVGGRSLNIVAPRAQRLKTSPWPLVIFALVAVAIVGYRIWTG